MKIINKIIEVVMIPAYIIVAPFCIIFSLWFLFSLAFGREGKKEIYYKLRVL